MGLKPQFKRSKVGVIPQDWKVRPLARLAKVRSGIAKNSNNAVSDSVLVHYLRVANVQDGFLDLSEMSTIRVSRSDVKRYAVRSGDVLMNEGGDLDKLGRGSIWHGQFSPCIHQNHVFVVRCGSRVCPDYLNAWTASAAARQYFMTAGKQTTNLASINKTALGQLPVALPTRVEQEAIAEVLNDADALIESLKQLIDKKRLIKQGAMQELLAGKKRLPGFEIKPGCDQTEVGQIPQDWELKPMAELFTFQNGVNADRSAYERGVPFINVLEVIKHPTITETRIPGRITLTLQAIKAYAVERGDVLFNRTSETQEEVGLASVYTGDETVVFGGFVIRARPRDGRMDPFFTAFSLRSSIFRSQIVARGQGAVRANIGQKDLSQVLAVLPAKAEQEAIAAVLSDMDAEIAGIKEMLAKTRFLKKGMMQQLLTGKIRLI